MRVHTGCLFFIYPLIGLRPVGAYTTVCDAWAGAGLFNAFVNSKPLYTVRQKTAPCYFCNNSVYNSYNREIFDKVLPNLLQK